MEIRIFRTMIRTDNMYGCNAYAQGKIAGIMCVVCDIPNGMQECAPMKFSEIPGVILTTRCTQEQYDIFKQTIDYMGYSSICEFDYQLVD